MDDREIRATLQAIRRAPVPPVPRLRRPWPLAPIAAAALLLAIVAAILFQRPQSHLARPASEIPARLERVEHKIDAVENDELKALLRREAELLRMELELARK